MFILCINAILQNGRKYWKDFLCNNTSPYEGNWHYNAPFVQIFNVKLQRSCQQCIFFHTLWKVSVIDAFSRRRSHQYSASGPHCRATLTIVKGMNINKSNKRESVKLVTTVQAKKGRGNCFVYLSNFYQRLPFIIDADLLCS